MEGPAPCVVCAVAADLAALDRPVSDGAASSHLAARRRFLHEDFAGDGHNDAAEAMRGFLERCVEADAPIPAATATATAIVATTVTAPATARVFGGFPWKGE